VILWPDTFNNFFRAETAVAATRVLERAGFEVEIPARVLCCGRPLYDWGWIDQAKALWRTTLDTLRPQIEQGVAVIGLEPACVSAFQDELPALFPDDRLARALSRQTFLLSDFFVQRGLEPAGEPREAEALVQFHCHHHATLKTHGERALLNRLFARTEIVNGGCCGMAGAFGLESAKYDLSMRIGERTLLPRVRAAPPRTLIVADGFSCREQIEQTTGRRTVHIADLLERAWAQQ
jgi:Fe-S oxidoreductase